jgi:tetratricopeptide (TPR) repeat protein
MALSGEPEEAIKIYEQIMVDNPGSTEAQKAHLGIADTYYKRMNDQEKGLEVYEKVAESYPDTESSSEAYWAIGMHYFQAKDYETARQNFSKVIQTTPGTEKAHDAALAIAKCYEEMKKYDEAASAYIEFSKNHPTHRLAAQAGLDAARIYDSRLENTDEAVEAYKHVASNYSISSSGREAIKVLEEMGEDTSELIQLPETEEPQMETQPQTTMSRDRRRRRATNVPRAEIGGVQDTEEIQRQTVSEDFGVDPMELMPMGVSGDSQGTMYDAFYMYANMNLQSRQYKEAGALYEKALELAGNKPWDNAARAYFGLAKSYKGIGMDDKAAQMFKEAIKRDRKIIDSMIASGETYYGDEDYEEALKAYKTAVGLVPHKDSEIYYKMGLVYQRTGDLEKEVESFERAVALKPNYKEAIEWLAYVLFNKKKDATRGELYDSEARGRGSSDYKVQKELGDLCYRYGKIFSEEPDREKQSGSCYSWAKIKYGNSVRIVKRSIDSALADFIKAGDASQASQIAEDLSNVTLKQVSEAAASGNQLAIDALEGIRELLADYRLMTSRIAISQARVSRNEQAQKELDELIAEDPGALNSAEYHFAMAELAISQGNTGEAVTSLKKALEINPEHKEANERLNQLGVQGEVSEAGAAG